MKIISRTDISSSLAPFKFFKEWKINYPVAVIQALGEIYAEYNKAFLSLVHKNREWDSDYQFCNGPVNWAVQIDMKGLSEETLMMLGELSAVEVNQYLRGQIFEVENSLAMYQFLQKSFTNGNGKSYFDRRFRQVLEGIREKFARPIALIAVTEEKYLAMRASEFGKKDGEYLSDSEVLELSGFDRFFGPVDFRKHLEENAGECGYLLYARTSHPVAKLKCPEFHVDQPLLGDDNMRRIIKRNALTLNVDNPCWSEADDRRINDTKLYMPPLGMGLLIETPEDVHKCSIEGHLRAKPSQGTYGCYGHVRGDWSKAQFMKELRRGMKKYGRYVVQPELLASEVEIEGLKYAFIDRNFFGWVGDRPIFLGGFRNLISADTEEVRRGRIHGNREAVFAEILASE